MGKKYFNEWFHALLPQVCKGCGVCAGSCPVNGIENQWRSDRGYYIPRQTDQCVGCGRCQNVCSAADRHPERVNEELFHTAEARFCEELGYYRQTYVGFAPDEKLRWNGASGGAVTWLLTQLFEQKKIDYAVAVQSQEDQEPLFRCRILDSVQSIQESSRSSYYPVEFSEVLKQIRKRPGRCAVIALPCVCHSIRLLQKQDALFRERITCVFGLSCGIQKSARFAEELAKRCNFSGDIRKITFRTKDPQTPAYDFGIRIAGDNSSRELRMYRDGVIRLWVSDIGSIPGCFFCDDHFAECADLTFMDAWLPEYTSPCGTNLIVDRSGLLEEFSGIFEPIAVERVLESQAGAYRKKQLRNNVLTGKYKLGSPRRPLKLSFPVVQHVLAHYRVAAASSNPPGFRRTAALFAARCMQFGWKAVCKMIGKKSL